jgi:hypothetical protein
MNEEEGLLRQTFFFLPPSHMKTGEEDAYADHC